jgi:hypothetical protein
MREVGVAKKSIKQWYKFTKFYRGGSHDDFFLLDHKPREEDMRRWGEATDGGAEDGYRVTWKREDPPVEVIEKKILRKKRSIEGLKDVRKELVEELRELEGAKEAR